MFFEIAQQRKVLASNPEGLSQIPGTHKWMGRTESCKLSCALHFTVLKIPSKYLYLLNISTAQVSYAGLVLSMESRMTLDSGDQHFLEVQLQLLYNQFLFLNLSQWIHLYTSKLVRAYFFQQEYSLCKLSSLICHTSLGFEVSHKQRTERCFWTNVIASEVMSFRVTSVKEKENTTTVL